MVKTRNIEILLTFVPEFGIKFFSFYSYIFECYHILHEL